MQVLCEQFGRPESSGRTEEFRRHVLNAHNVEAWFQHRNKYAKGESIVGNILPPVSKNMHGQLLVVVVSIVAVLVLYI